MSVNYGNECVLGAMVHWSMLHSSDNSSYKIMQTAEVMEYETKSSRPGMSICHEIPK